jgi:hypothetical protein
MAVLHVIKGPILLQAFEYLLLQRPQCESLVPRIYFPVDVHYGELRRACNGIRHRPCEKLSHNIPASTSTSFPI